MDNRAQILRSYHEAVNFANGLSTSLAAMKELIATDGNNEDLGVNPAADPAVCISSSQNFTSVLELT